MAKFDLTDLYKKQAELDAAKASIPTHKKEFEINENSLILSGLAKERVHVFSLNFKFLKK